MCDLGDCDDTWCDNHPEDACAACRCKECLAGKRERQRLTRLECQPESGLWCFAAPQSCYVMFLGKLFVDHSFVPPKTCAERAATGVSK